MLIFVLFVLQKVGFCHFTYLTGVVHANQRSSLSPSSRIGSTLIAVAHSQKGSNDVFLFSGFGISDRVCSVTHPDVPEYGILPDFYVFSLEETQWYHQESPKCPFSDLLEEGVFPRARYQGNSIRIDEDSFVLFGGISYANYNGSITTLNNDAWKYHIPSKTWTFLESQGVIARADSFHFTANNEHYIFGGYSIHSETSHFECSVYNDVKKMTISADELTSSEIFTNSLPPVTVGHTVWQDNNEVFVFGGYELSPSCQFVVQNTGERVWKLSTAPFSWTSITAKYGTDQVRDSIHLGISYGLFYTCFNVEYIFGGQSGALLVNVKTQYTYEAGTFKDASDTYPINHAVSHAGHVERNLSARSSESFFFGGVHVKSGGSIQYSLFTENIALANSLTPSDPEYAFYNTFEMYECRKKISTNADPFSTDWLTVGIVFFVVGIFVIIFAVFCCLATIFVRIDDKRSAKKNAGLGKNSFDEEMISILTGAGLERYIKTFHEKNVIVYDLYYLANDDDLEVIMESQADVEKLKNYLKENPIKSFSLNSGAVKRNKRKRESRSGANVEMVEVKDKEEIERQRVQKVRNDPPDSQIMELGAFCAIPLDPFDPTLIGRWGRTIATGAYGSIRLGYIQLDDELFFRVAVKIIKVDLTNQTKEEVLREVDIMKSVKHPYCLRTFGCFFMGSDAHIVSEFCELGDLFTYKKKLGVIAKVRLLKNIAEGIQYLHKSGIVHRDIKSQNVLMTMLDGKLSPKICDFGASGHSASVTSTLVGTPEYLAPEQYDNKLMVAGKQYLIDIYSFGILMWEIFYGRLPFSKLKKQLGGNVFEFMRVIYAQKLRPPMKDLPERIQNESRLVKLMHICWQEKPAHRPQSLEPVVLVLKAVLEDFQEKRK